MRTIVVTLITSYPFYLKKLQAFTIHFFYRKYEYKKTTIRFIRIVVFDINC